MSQGGFSLCSFLERFRVPPKTVWDRETYLKAAEVFQTYRPLELKDFQNALSAVWDDLEEFPVSEPTYEDSWLLRRSFGGGGGITRAAISCRRRTGGIFYRSAV